MIIFFTWSLCQRTCSCASEVKRSWPPKAASTFAGMEMTQMTKMAKMYDLILTFISFFTKLFLLFFRHIKHFRDRFNETFYVRNDYCSKLVCLSLEASIAWPNICAWTVI